jgi:hypothetical protein
MKTIAVISAKKPAKKLVANKFSETHKYSYFKYKLKGAEKLKEKSLTVGWFFWWK